MNKFLGIGAVLALLAACDERPTTEVVDDPVDPVDPVEDTTDALSAGDLQSATYEPGSLTIQITMDGQNVDQDYGTPVALGDFELFTLTEGTTGRAFTAVAGEVPGEVNAVIVSDGGQFNRYFGGGQIVQFTYTAPDGGITDYMGQYVGLLNFGPLVNDPIPTGVGDESYASLLVEGSTFLKVDFNDGYLNGSIYDRTIDGGGDPDILLPDVILTDGILAADGTFTGTAEDAEQNGVGSFSGAIGGEGTSIAGLVELTPPFLEGVTEFTDLNGNEAEIGMFILVPVAP